VKRLLVTALSAVVLLLVTACGGSGDERPATRTAENGDLINQADIEFASDMIVLNAQSLQLVNMLRDHTTSARLIEVGEHLLMELSVQTEQLVNWLTDWGVSIPETPLDHANGGHEGDEGHGDGMQIEGDEMPGLLSSEQVEKLSQLKGDEFDRAWIELCAEQRHGALKIAQRAVTMGVFKPLLRLARLSKDQQGTNVRLIKGQ